MYACVCVCVFVCVCVCVCVCDWERSGRGVHLVSFFHFSACSCMMLGTTTFRCPTVKQASIVCVCVC